MYRGRTGFLPFLSVEQACLSDGYFIFKGDVEFVIDLNFHSPTEVRDRAKRNTSKNAWLRRVSLRYGFIRAIHHVFQRFSNGLPVFINKSITAELIYDLLEVVRGAR